MFDVGRWPGRCRAHPSFEGCRGHEGFLGRADIIPIFFFTPSYCPRKTSVVGGAFASLGLFLPLLLVAAAPVAPAPPETLRSAAEVLSLSAPAAAARVPVAITGIVTAAEPDWQGKFFLQDSSGGIFVYSLARQPAIGDVVEVTGFSSPGAFAPTLHLLDWRKIGHGPLPAAKQVTLERLMAGVEDGQRVEVSGLVRSAVFVPAKKLMVEISIGGYRVRVFPKLPPGLNTESLIAAKVRVRGTVATSFNAARRQLTAVNLYVPTADDFVVEEAEQNGPFELPLVALGDIARYRRDASVANRLHVKGTLTFQRVGQDLFLQDSTGGVHVESLQATPLPLGRTVEAVGFIEFVNFQPVLKDAVFRDLPVPATPIAGEVASIADLRNGLHPAELIVLQGRLLDRNIRPIRRDNVSFAGFRVTCTVQTPDLTFTAESDESQEMSRIAAVPLGSLVELRGVASFETGDDGKLSGLSLLLPDADSVRILERPSWFTAERLLIGFAIVCILLAGVAAWLLTVSKKNAMLSFLVADREKAQKELQEAHDQLEQRVKERTEQLKVEMSVRRAAELEFRATLTERTRLARELHDTLEQALTGIALQLDTAARLFLRNPQEASQPLELAREFLHQSQVGLRRSIWDLRSRELEQFDLSEALAISCRQIAAGSHIRIDAETEGERQRLPEIVEESLLRIAQEALTNVVKHSGATAVNVRLVFNGDAVSLEIKDNGSGLVTDHVAGAGHFGLLGMTERAKRLGGRLDVSSSPGEGTTVRVLISLRGVPPEAPAVETNGSHP
jgi:signal transduction histidine kinase